jgi:hypothetical protein
MLARVAPTVINLQQTTQSFRPVCVDFNTCGIELVLFPMPAAINLCAVYIRADVRFGSLADILRRDSDVRFTPKSGHPKLAVALSRISDKHRRARQSNDDFGELAGLRIDLDRAAMLFDNDIVTYRKAEAGTFSRWFGRKEGIEHFVFDLGRNASSIVANPDLHSVAKVFR